MKKVYPIVIALFFLQQITNAQTYSRAWVNDDSLTYPYNKGGGAVQLTTTDIHGNTYICYVSDSGFTRSVAVKKVNTLGETAWETFLIPPVADDQFQLPRFIVADTLENLYVLITSGISAPVILKYNSAGNLVWRKNYTEKPYGAAFGMLLKQDNSLIVLCNSFDSTGQYGLSLRKVNTDGSTVFYKLYQIPKSTSGVSACLDNKGNIIVAREGGNHKPHPTFSKYDIKGNFLFTDTFTLNYRLGFLKSVACDSVGNIYAYGEIYPGQPGHVSDSVRIITIKYNNAGKQLWFTTQEPGIDIYFSADLLVSKGGNFWITKSVNNLWQTKGYNNNGNLLWTAVLVDSLRNYDIPFKMLDDNEGNVYVNGQAYQQGINGGSEAIVGYNKSGKKIYFNSLNRPAPSKQYPPEVKTFGFNKDANDNLYSVNLQTDYSNKTGIYESFFVAKYQKTLSNFSQKGAPEPVSILKLYPNPVVNNISVDFTTSSSSKNYKLIISDVSGNVVLIKQLNRIDKITHINIDVSSLKTGVYTMNISDGVNSVFKTFLKR